MEVALGQGGAPRTAAPARGGVAEGDGRQTRTWQFTKTKMCKFHIVGMCVKGANCAFAHEKVELRPLPDLTCTKLCKRLIQTGSCEDSTCTYAHTKDELRATSTFHKTKLCRFSQIGHCALGSKCNFAHSLDEVRPLEGPIPQAPPVPVQMTAVDELYSEQQLNEAHMLLQQQYALAQQQQQTPPPQGSAYAATFAGSQPQYFVGMGAPPPVPGPGSQDSPYKGPGSAPKGGAAPKGGFGKGGKQGRGPVPGACSSQMGQLGPNEQLPMDANNSVLPAPPPVDDSQQRRRGGRRAREVQAVQPEKGSGKGRGKSKEATEASSQLASTFEGAGTTAVPGMPQGDMASLAGTMGTMGSLTGVPGLDWIARQGQSVPQMPESQSPGVLAQEPPYSGNHASQPFPNAPAVQFVAKTTDDLKDCPAYITQTTSDFVVKNTFLEFGTIGGPLRPVRSAAGRLDLLGGSGGESSEGLCDLAAGLRSHGSAGSLSTMDRPDGGEYGNGETEYMSQAALRGKGARYYDDADTAGNSTAVTPGDLAGAGGSSSMLSDGTPQSGYGASEGAAATSWDEALFKGSFTINQRDDVWQVKNTFLTFTPQTKPIRSVRTAEGALCRLGALGDDE